MASNAQPVGKPVGDPPVPPTPDPQEHLSLSMQFTIDDEGTIHAATRILPNGETRDATMDGVSYTQLAAGFVLETRTAGTQSIYEVFYDGDGDGNYLAVAHGNATSVDLVGLQAQLTAGSLIGLV